MKRKRMTKEDGLALTQNLMGVVIGPYKISNLSDGEIYVGNDEGEGGVFRTTKLIPFLNEFWKQEF